MLSSPTPRSSSARAAGRRWRTYLLLVVVLSAAIATVAISPLHPVNHGISGLMLVGIAVLVLISLVSSRTPSVDGAFSPQWSLDGLRTVPARCGQPKVPGARVEYDVIVAPAAVLVADRRHYSPAAQGEIAPLLDDLQAADRAAARFRAFVESEQALATVIPVLIVSGPGAPQLPTGHCVDNGVHIVDGTHPELWMHLFNEPQLPTSYRNELFERLANPTDTERVKVLPALSAAGRTIVKDVRLGMAEGQLGTLVR